MVCAKNMFLILFKVSVQNILKDVTQIGHSPRINKLKVKQKVGNNYTTYRVYNLIPSMLKDTSNQYKMISCNFLSKDNDFNSVVDMSTLLFKKQEKYGYSPQIQLCPYG